MPAIFNEPLVFLAIILILVAPLSFSDDVFQNLFLGLFEVGNSLMEDKVEVFN